MAITADKEEHEVGVSCADGSGSPTAAVPGMVFSDVGPGPPIMGGLRVKLHSLSLSGMVPTTSKLAPLRTTIHGGEGRHKPRGRRDGASLSEQPRPPSLAKPTPLEAEAQLQRALWLGSRVPSHQVWDKAPEAPGHSGNAGDPHSGPPLGSCDLL